jgi:hypothetical protein
MLERSRKFRVRNRCLSGQAEAMLERPGMTGGQHGTSVAATHAKVIEMSDCGKHGFHEKGWGERS